MINILYLYFIFVVAFYLNSVNSLQINYGKSNVMSVEAMESFLYDDNATYSQCPDMYQVQFDTDITDRPIVVEVNRTLAPIGADRFYALIKDGFYDTGALFRVVPGFVLQFGISGNPDQNEKWLHSPIQDDPVIGSNLRGSITFAAEPKPNSRTTQVFINYADNSHLDAMGFAPFGVVIIGLDIAISAHNPTPGDSGGVDQNEYEEKGNAWIEQAYPGINFMEKAVLHM